MSTAKIIIDGAVKGTAWLIHMQHVVTAAHCVGSVGTKAQVQFFNPGTGGFDVGVEATVVVRNARLDAALLRLDAARADLPALPVTKYGMGNSHPNWNGMGFPAVAEGLVGIFGFSGSVEAMRTSLLRAGQIAPAIQLTCLQGTDRLQAQNFVDPDGVPIHMLAGISGSAICLPDRGDRVVGIVRCAMSPLGAGVIYASPIEEVWAEFAGHLPGVVLHEWRRTAGTVRNNPAAGGVISNVDEELIAAAWKDDVVKDITVDVPWDGAGPLIPAILRVVLHQPGIARLHVRNPVAWNERLRRYADAWIALERFNPNERANPALDCAQPNTDLGTSYPTAAAVAEAIHAACDRFVLDYLDERLAVMFEAQQPGDYAGFPIAADVLQYMAATWAIWRAQLRADPALLHHFLALMLTHQGSHDCTAEPSPGAGPLTMKECILPATIFGLAIAPFLPNALVPKRPQPGNIGQDQTTGHSCGILAVKRQRLDSELRGHQWPTQVVLLQQLQYLPAEWQAATGTLLSSGRSPRPTLSRPAPSALIITCDEETRLAIRTSVQAVRDHLAGRHAQQVQIRQDYAASAGTPV